MNATLPGVFYPKEPRVVLGAGALAMVRAAAADVDTGRARFCAHESLASDVQEMLIVQTRASYVRPHKHIGKSESLLLLEGEIDAFFFDDDGAISERLRMRAYSNGGPFFYRIAPLAWHSMIVISEHIVMQEVTGGPFLRHDTEFAPWSPAVDDTDGIARFLRMLGAGTFA